MQVTTFAPTLQLGDHGPAVIDLQTLLNQQFASDTRGGVIETLTLDGFYGSKTEAAVRIAQFRYLLFQDGIAGPLTWRSLENKAVLFDQLPTLRLGDRGNTVVVVQSTLDPTAVGVTDGYFGPQTEAAVKDYQAGSNLLADGIVGQKTWRALEQRALAQLV